MRKIVSIVLILISVICLSSCEKNKAELNVEDIHAICELATVKCYYNNVAKIEKKKDNVFQKDRKMWIEYEGEAIIGVDMSEVKVDVKSDVVNVTLPKAKILSIKPKKETLNENSYVISEDRLIFKNKITTEEQENAIAQGQAEMEKAINSNSSLFVKAESNAKQLIKNYIDSLSKTIGKSYTINWK